jgi:hypothetical protein
MSLSAERGEGVEALPKPALELVGSHGRTLRRRFVTRPSACLFTYVLVA